MSGVEIRNNGALCTYDSGTGDISGCGLPVGLSPGEAVNLLLTYTAPASGAVTVTSDITADAETNTANNISSGDTTVSSQPVPDVYTLVDLPATVAPGDTVNALVSFGNQGPVNAAGVGYEVTLPPGLSGG